MKKNVLSLFMALFLTGFMTAHAQSYSVVFDGVDDYIDFGNSTLFNANTIRTMECWVKFNNFTGSQELMSKSISGQGIELLIYNNGLAAYFMNGSSYSFISYPTSNLVTGRWYHVAITWNGTKETIQLYVNGIPVGTRTDGPDINVSGLSNAAPSFRIGDWPDATRRPFSGTIDEARVWNVMRTGAQIRQGMFKVPANSSGLVAYYKLDEGSGTTANNSTANAGLNGTLTNGPTWATSPIQNTSTGVQIDGVDDYVSVPGNSAYDITTGTVECLIRPDGLNTSVNECFFGNRGTGGTRYSFHITPTTLGFFNGTYLTLPYTFTNGQWYQIAFVIHASTTDAYVNGSLIGTYNQGAGTATLQTLIMGRVKDASEYEAFPGAIDEVRIWNTQRTQTQIQTYQNNTLTGTEAGLVGLFSFDQGIPSGTNTGLVTVVDRSNTANVGTLNNFALTGSTSNFIADAAVPLPVTYLSFTANRQNQKVLLQWQTSQEKNSASFIIERSADGRNYSDIGKVSAAGNTGLTQTYTYTDEMPLNAKNYYRLNQVDVDGSFNYSVVRIVDLGKAPALNWYATGRSIQVILDNGNNEPYKLADMRGAILQTGRLLNGRIQFSGLPAGVYTIQVQSTVSTAARFVVP